MSDLQFQEGARPRLRSFYGRSIDKMPLLLADGRVPMTPRQLLHERVHGANEHDRNLLRDNYVDTACAVITGSSGEVLVSLYAHPLVKELICSLNPDLERRLRYDSLPVGTDVYQEIKKDALVIPAGVARDLRGNWCSHQKTREAFWDYVTEDDEGLVRDHLRLVQERKGGNMENRMGLWLSGSSGLRLLRTMSVGGSHGGGAGGSILNYYNGRLVGVSSTGGA